MRWFLCATLAALSWAVIFGAISLGFGRSTEAMAHGAIAAFFFGLAGMHVGRWWRP